MLKSLLPVAPFSSLTPFSMQPPYFSAPIRHIRGGCALRKENVVTTLTWGAIESMTHLTMSHTDTDRLLPRMDSGFVVEKCSQSENKWENNQMYNIS